MEELKTFHTRKAKLQGEASRSDDALRQMFPHSSPKSRGFLFKTFVGKPHQVLTNIEHQAKYQKEIFPFLNTGWKSGAVGRKKCLGQVERTITSSQKPKKMHRRGYRKIRYKLKFIFPIQWNVYKVYRLRVARMDSQPSLTCGKCEKIFSCSWTISDRPYIVRIISEIHSLSSQAICLMMLTEVRAKLGHY